MDLNYITETDIGWIIASFSLAQVMVSPFNSRIKNYLGTKNTMQIGMFLVMISTVGLGAIAHVKSNNTFKYIALVLRFI